MCVCVCVCVCVCACVPDFQAGRMGAFSASLHLLRGNVPPMCMCQKSGFVEYCVFRALCREIQFIHLSCNAMYTCYL